MERWSYRKVEEWRDTVVAVSRVSRMAAVGSRSCETEDDLLLCDMGARRKDTEKRQNRTPHRTQRTRIFFSLCAVLHSSFMCSRFIQFTCIGSRRDGSSQHWSRVFKTVRLLHCHSTISCLVVTSWTCLSVVLLFLTDRRQNRVSPASPAVAVVGLVQWPNSLTQRNLIEIFSHHTPINFPSRRNRVSLLTSTACPPLPRLMPQTLLDAGMTFPLITKSLWCFCPSASSSKHPQQPASPNVINSWHTSNGGSCGKLQQCVDTHVVGSCGKLQRSDCTEVEKSMLKGKRDREFGSLSSQEQEKFLSERPSLHDNFESKTWRVTSCKTVGLSSSDGKPQQIGRIDDEKQFLPRESCIRMHGN